MLTLFGPKVLKIHTHLRQKNGNPPLLRRRQCLDRTTKTRFFLCVSVTDPILQMTSVRFQWPGRAGFALSVDAFRLMRGETMILLGESGSGKSTLLSLVCGTVSPHSGEVRVAGTDLSDLSSGARDAYRAEQLGIVFEQFNLLPFGSVLDNILLPLQFAPARRARIKDGPEEALRLCTALGLPNILSAKAAKLSVGQQQRVAVARALMGRPPLLIADEPTSALDETSQMAFLDVLFDQVKAQSSSLLMVSHNPRLAERFDRVVKMTDIARVGQAAA